MDISRPGNLIAGEEITMSESLPKLHSVAAAAEHLGVLTVFA
jgi:hypothetical protein